MTKNMELCVTLKINLNTSMDFFIFTNKSTILF